MPPGSRDAPWPAPSRRGWVHFTGGVAWIDCCLWASHRSLFFLSPFRVIEHARARVRLLLGAFDFHTHPLSLAPSLISPPPPLRPPLVRSSLSPRSMESVRRLREVVFDEDELLLIERLSSGATTDMVSTARSSLSSHEPASPLGDPGVPGGSRGAWCFPAGHGWGTSDPWTAPSSAGDGVAGTELSGPGAGVAVMPVADLDCGEFTFDGAFSKAASARKVT